MKYVVRECRVLLPCWLACTVFIALSAPSRAVSFLGSFSSDETIAGVEYEEEDIVEVDNSSVAEFLDGDSLFTGEEDIDALFVDSDGSIYFSTSAGATVVDGFGGIDSGDIVRFDPTAAAGSMFTLFIADTGPNVDALWIEDGTPYLSLSVDSTVGSNALAVTDDVVFTLSGTDLSTSEATAVLDSNDFLLDPGEEPDTGTDIDAFAITDDGHYLFSSSSSNSFLVEGGDPGNPADFIRRDGGVIYILDPNNPASFDAREEASIYFDPNAELTFEPEESQSVNIDALHLLADDDPAVEGDFSGDGQVDGADLSLLLGFWGDSVPLPLDSGWDGSQPVGPIVDSGELSDLLGNWGFGVEAGPGPAQVPEPSTVVLSFAACAVFAAVGRRKSGSV